MKCVPAEGGIEGGEELESQGRGKHKTACQVEAGRKHSAMPTKAAGMRYLNREKLGGEPDRCKGCMPTNGGSAGWGFQGRKTRASLVQAVNCFG